MATVYFPNLNNSRADTLLAGIRHMPTQYLNAGRALHPLQRNGSVADTSFPVEAVIEGHSIQGNHVAPNANLTQPPVFAFSQPVSHTRMPAWTL